MVGMLRRIAHLPNTKFIGIDMVEFILHLLLDHFFEFIDGCVLQNPNPKDGVDVVSEIPTVDQDFIHDGFVSNFRTRALGLLRKRSPSPDDEWQGCASYSV